MRKDHGRRKKKTEEKERHTDWNEKKTRREGKKVSIMRREK
jgi:hypothetical protein